MGDRGLLIGWLALIVLVSGLGLLSTCWYAVGQHDGRTEACSALCGDHWAWEGRCVCLEPSGISGGSP